MIPAALEIALVRGLKERGHAATLGAARRVSGGCIHQTALLELDRGKLFLKWNRDAAAMFAAEAEGLQALELPAAASDIRVPTGAWTGTSEDGVWSFLVMEAVSQGAPGAAFQRRFGASLARLHRASRSHRFGFDHDNFLGATPQPNDWCDDWVEFWRRHRLGHQLGLARRRGRSDAELDRLGDRLSDRLEGFLAGPDEPACLLHGDLWGGNYLVDEAGEPVLIDPACYYGRREAELAMTRLFGGFDRDFYSGYEEVWPLAPGAEERLAVYELYHLLNHLNLFGPSYRGGCVARLRRLVG